MAIYEFVCARCGRKFEELIMGDASAAVVSCPSCGGTEVKRLVSTFAYNGGSGFKTSASPSGGCAVCGGGSCSTCH